MSKSMAKLNAEGCDDESEFIGIVASSIIVFMKASHRVVLRPSAEGIKSLFAVYQINSYSIHNTQFFQFLGRS